MRVSMWWPRVVVCAAGCAACGSVHNQTGGPDAAVSDAGADAAVDGTPIDTDGGPQSEFASCTGLPATCGNADNDSCCTSLLLPGGTYYRSFDPVGDIHSGNMTHVATVSGFRLDKYEVTVARFRAFVNAGMGTQDRPPGNRAGEHPRIPGSGWDPNWNTKLPATTTALIASTKCDTALATWTDQVAGNEHRPMNCVSWYEAMAFCIWDGGRLPTEAEWNYAASGGDQQRAYPWSNPAISVAIDGSHASYFDGSDCIGDALPGCTLTDLVPVGTKFLGNGRWGHSDLGGNVQEWTLDWSAPYPSPCEDCASLVAAVNREVRGGSFTANDDDLRAGARIGALPAKSDGLTGIRCARAP